MSIQREIVLKVNSKEAQKGLDQTSKSLSGVGKSAETSSKGFKKMGIALKGMGIGLIIGVLSMLFEAFKNNQTMIDLVGRVMVKVSQIVGVFVDILE